jgi:hypothetical protein
MHPQKQNRMNQSITIYTIKNKHPCQIYTINITKRDKIHNLDNLLDRMKKGNKCL